MMTKYTEETPLAVLDPVELGIRLSELVAETMPWLEGVSGLRAGVAPAVGKWSAKEVVGHLTDSAVNNLARIVRLETVLDMDPEVRADNYEQEAWVLAQAYAEKDWLQIVQLWRGLNEHIGWTMRHVSREKLGRICVFPDGQVTMGFLMEDYIAHMEHHLRDLKGWL